MNRVLIFFCACASLALHAQEGGEAALTDGIDPSLVKAATAKPAAKYFHALVRFCRADSEVLVKLPRQQDFTKAVEGKFYPNGSAFRVEGGAEFEFGKEATLSVKGGAEFSTRETAYDAQPRTVVLTRGAITVSLPRTLPTGLFSVAYPNFTAKDMAGESNHELTPSGDGNEAVVHVITGMLAVDGLHYAIARMNAADRIRIRTTGDALFTSLRGEAGDYKVSLDQGTATYRDPISGVVSNQVRHLDFSLTPQCAIKIFRKRSQVGGRMVVSMMTFDPSGEMRNRYTFAEGIASVNFGEEVVRIQDISFKTKAEKDKKGLEGKKPSDEAKAEGDTSDDSGADGSGNGGGFGDNG